MRKFLLLFLLLPLLLSGMTEKKYKRLQREISKEWEAYDKTAKQIGQNSNSPREVAAQLQDCFTRCRKIEAVCNDIIFHISKKSLLKRMFTWRNFALMRSKYLKLQVDEHLVEISKVSKELAPALAAEEAKALYDKSLLKAEEGAVRIQGSKRTLENIEEVVRSLQESAECYRAAATLAGEAVERITPYALTSSEEVLREAVAAYEKCAQEYQLQAEQWPERIAEERAALKAKCTGFLEDAALLSRQGLQRSAYLVQQQVIALYEQLGKECLEELSTLQSAVARFEEVADANRLTSTASLLAEEFQKREAERRALFFQEKSAFESVVPIDGQVRGKQAEFTLFTEQFYRFLLRRDTPLKSLKVTVYEGSTSLCEEEIILPDRSSWEGYLREGLLFIPDTRVKKEYGIDLRLRISSAPFSLLIAQKGSDPNYSLTLSCEEGTLYSCRFLTPPPWQLDLLRKPRAPLPHSLRGREGRSQVKAVRSEAEQEGTTSREEELFEKLIKELKRDPLRIAGYVQNEIALSRSYLYEEDGRFFAPAAQRSPSMTYLAKEGTPWEQCQLLLSLLRRAGYEAFYGLGDSALPRAAAEQLLLTKVAGEEALLHYPWVLFKEGEEWISLFPWLKQIEIHEGEDLYTLLPEKYGSAHRWITHYLRGDEQILRHIGPDGDDTAGLLFRRYVEEELRRQGLCVGDVGLHHVEKKEQLSLWEEFPRPRVGAEVEIFSSTAHLPQAMTHLTISGRRSPEKRLHCSWPTAGSTARSPDLHFAEDGRLSLQLPDGIESIAMPEEEVVEITLRLDLPVGQKIHHHEKSFPLDKGSRAALCFHIGGSSSPLSLQPSLSGEADRQIASLLSLVGASYFERCSRSEQWLADLHKIRSTSVGAFGLAKLSAHGEPALDLCWFYALPDRTTPSLEDHRDSHFDYTSLMIADSSSNEHQVLSEFFNDPHAISTTRLLQLAHEEERKRGSQEDGFLFFSKESLLTAEMEPLKESAGKQWEAMREAFAEEHCSGAYAYMTPGAISSRNGAHRQVGTLILSPRSPNALIGHNLEVIHGALGSSIPWQEHGPLFENFGYYTPRFPPGSKFSDIEFAPHKYCHPKHPLFAEPEWKLPQFPSQKFPSQKFPSKSSSPSHRTPPPPTPVETRSWNSDIRLPSKPIWNQIADPIDTVTGAFYIDETDLIVPGSFPLVIRRNYNSQNPLKTALGCGWKLGLNPFLIEQDGKRFVAELDGTVLAYRYNERAERWEVTKADNPELFISGEQNLFHSYIQGDILYSPDGSRRHFAEGRLQKWVDARGNSLTFCYTDHYLTRIESEDGDYLSLRYNHQGWLVEIYTSDGRGITYRHNRCGDLVQVTLPNRAEIFYEYDHHHRILRETKPHGRVVENIYDREGRVLEQRTPVGPRQQMMGSLFLTYGESSTKVTDAAGGTTLYKIFEKQIYKIIDPLGGEILQAWFIDRDSWFDPEKEALLPWEGGGGAPNSLRWRQDRGGLRSSYLYDSRGNPIEISMEGEDLTGRGLRKIVKKRIYNSDDLLIREECGEHLVTTQYDETFPHLPKREEHYCDNSLLSYVDCTYDSSGRLIREERSGAITLFTYTSRGQIAEKTQLTNTSDPDLLTRYLYSPQGECTKILSPEGREEYTYDLMGNQISSAAFSPSGECIATEAMGYDLNNALIWKKGGIEGHITYFDQGASGMIKAKREVIAPSSLIAYTLYEYDTRGYLIEETDPCGYTTYRKYDALGRVITETKEGHTTHFSYDPGGNLTSITSPAGSRTERHYTTNGLLKEEIYPDGTSKTLCYDHLGRPILESQAGSIWDITYDDLKQRTTRTHRATGEKEIHQFDARGNLVRSTDRAGYTYSRSYDGLNRLSSETTPTGARTEWHYLGDKTISINPAGERHTTYRAAGRSLRSTVEDSSGTLLMTTSLYIDPRQGYEEERVGEEKSATWRNALGLPIRIVRGETLSTYTYDPSGHCICVTDGDGRVIRQSYDGLGRLVSKELPDGNRVTFTYDLDSNLIAYQLPNGNIWSATYDKMHRKESEKLSSHAESTMETEYTYAEGRLKRRRDALGRIHTYSYDAHGRMSEDRVGGASCRYQYDPRGLLIAASQTLPHEESRLARSYNGDGKLTSEEIYLDQLLIQRTKQLWTPSSRTLHIDDHSRRLTYQNNQLVECMAEGGALHYSYTLSGALERCDTPFSSRTLSYSSGGLPQEIITHSTYPQKESMTWYPSGKLRSYSSPREEKSFSYTGRGQLLSAGQEEFLFDPAGVGIGSAHAAVTQLDPFGRATRSLTIYSSTEEQREYNRVGELITSGNSHYSWDPWGRLLAVDSPAGRWEASYDPLGRRIQSRYRASSSPAIILNSFYDPEEEFREIGIQINGKRFWKFYGPKGCDAMSDGDHFITLQHNALGNLTALLTKEGALHIDTPSSAYGPLSTPIIPSDLISYAASLSWRSQAKDPTGLIWMGKRYYDPLSGKFCSIDPLPYPFCLDLYIYANGDPINYLDPKGRFASPLYRKSAGILSGVMIATETYNRLGEPLVFASGLHQSAPIWIPGKPIPRGEISFINGIDVPQEKRLHLPRQISYMANNHEVHGVYNATNSWIPQFGKETIPHGLIFTTDILECSLAQLGVRMPPRRLLRNQWEEFARTHAPKDTLLQICHSAGAIHVRQALLDSPDSLRKRIQVLAIAPAAIIPNSLCLRSQNYMSLRDFVPYLDPCFILYCNQLTILPPHPDAPLFDHEFLSPTFTKVLQAGITNYLKGCEK